MNDVFLTPCTAWKKMLAATHPGDLTPEAYRQLQAHLASCPTCSAIRAEYESMGRAISQLPRIDQIAEPSLALATLLNASVYHDDETRVSSEASSPVPIRQLASFRPVERTSGRRIYKVLSTLAAVLVVAAVLGSFGALIASRYMRPGLAGASPSWQIIPSANPGSAGSILLSVASLSENDAWAVGSTSNTSISQPKQTLIEHWNGTQWSVVTSPNSGKAINILNNVVALSADDVWAVGGVSDAALTSTSTDQPLIEHWNGRQWSIVSLPLTAQLSNARSNTLSRLAVLSPNDVWGIGSSSDSAGHSTALIVHWNGSVWTIVPSPDTGSAVNGLRGIVAISPNDIWAVGASSTSNFDGIGHALIEHWNGTQWSIVPSPEIAKLGSANMSLNAVTAVSTNDVWAIGISTIPMDRSLIEHWDGTRWSVVASPNVPTWENFGSLTMLAANDIWAVGVSTSGSSIDGDKGLILHWNGKQWQFVSSPNRGSGTVLSGIGKIPGSTNVWVAGYYTDANNKTETLMLRYK